MKRAVVAVISGLVLAGCGGGAEGERGGGELGRVSSVTELRDALVDAGYECQNWQKDNVVRLAAESGTCDDSSVLSTYASEGDLQAQLDAAREFDELLRDTDVEMNPNLVGPNWIVNLPNADDYASELGGTVVGP